jgi:hypothetical protein
LGIPTFFRACCGTASQGCDIGYDHPGHELMRHVRDLVPYDADDDEWGASCDRLDDAIRNGDGARVLSWFVAHYPNCMALIPKRRRASFLRGVLAMAASKGDFDKMRMHAWRSSRSELANWAMPNAWLRELGSSTSPTLQPEFCPKSLEIT